MKRRLRVCGLLGRKAVAAGRKREVWAGPCKSPLACWLGGKSLLAKRIVGLIPEHTCYVEAFAGAAHVLFKKPPSRNEVINDLNGEVANLYEMVISRPKALARMFSLCVKSRELFEKYRDADPVNLDNLQRAFRLLYVLKCCFGGRLRRPNFGYLITVDKRSKICVMPDILLAAHARLKTVTVENGPWQDILARYDRPTTFFYLDPPYYGYENWYGEGMFSREQFKEMAERLRHISGKFLLSLNDAPEVRALFAGYHCLEESQSYSVNKGQRKHIKELLIANYPLPGGVALG